MKELPCQAREHPLKARLQLVGLDPTFGSVNLDAPSFSDGRLWARLETLADVSGHTGCKALTRCCVCRVVFEAFHELYLAEFDLEVAQADG